MTDVLDDIYSNFILMCIIAFILLFLFIFLSTKKPFKNKTFNSIYRIFMYLCSVGFFFTIPAFNYGHARSFEKICIGKTTICVFEPSIRAVGKSAGKPARLNILDKKTGKRIERFSAGRPAKMIGMRNDTVCYMNDDEVILYDAANLKQIYKIKNEEWGNRLQDLNVGVESVDAENSTSNYNIKPYIRLNCLNGKKYWFEPFSKMITTKYPGDSYIPSFSDITTELEVKYSQNKEAKYLFTANNGEGNLQAIFPGTASKTLFAGIDSTGYISPFLICIDTVKKVFVFGHYLTTKKEAFYLEAKDFKYRTQWKKLSTEIVDVDEDAKANIWLYENGILYIGIRSYFLAVNPLNFKTYWVTHL